MEISNDRKTPHWIQKRPNDARAAQDRYRILFERSPECLKLEVTESGVIQNPEVCIAKMRNLRAKGITFSSFGCNNMQGFLFGHPVPVDTFKDLLERQRNQ